jgi:hypothetical protein
VPSGPALRVEATVQARHNAGAGLAQTLLNGLCPGLGRQTRLFVHLYLHTVMMVFASIAATSFAILLLFSLPS